MTSMWSSDSMKRSAAVTSKEFSKASPRTWIGARPDSCRMAVNIPAANRCGSTWMRRLGCTPSCPSRLLNICHCRGGQVLVAGNMHGRIAKTGLSFAAATIWIWTVKDGAITRVEEYLDPTDMLSALGYQLRV